MKHYFYAALIVASGVVGLLLSHPSEPVGPLKSPHVKVTYEKYGGHGSATHIGNGYFLTAAHVIMGEQTPILTGDIKAEVLWVNEKYDVALLKADASGMDHADLECRTPDIGERVTMLGNPLNLDDITTWGYVAGVVREVGPWAEVMPMDNTIGPGMSGGALLDSDGDLVGINVGAMVWRQGLVPIGYSVPASTICKLMGLKR